LPYTPKISAKELSKIVQKLGFFYSHTTGSHMVYKHDDGRVIVIPNHPGEKIGTGLLLKIIKKDLNMSKEEFFKLL
jgi:predicted RNA binding protein YcfA (HicA-like mRNA interferase family)